MLNTVHLAAELNFVKLPLAEILLPMTHFSLKLTLQPRLGSERVF